MKKSLLLLCLTGLLSVNLFSQEIQKYFDYQWKPCEPAMARFFAIIRNTDSGWLRNDFFVATKKLQMKGLYKDSSCQIQNGRFYFFHSNGNLQSTGIYHNNKKEGLWLSYHYNGIMSDSSVYEYGKIKGTSLSWHDTGFLSDSIVVSQDGSAVAVSWFADGAISSAGRLSPAGDTIGKWQFFHHNGKPSALELYDKGTLIKQQYFSEDGTPADTMVFKTRAAAFQGGVAGWLKYLENKLSFPPNYEITNSDKISIVTEFTVDDSGAVKEVHVVTPFHPAFDETALTVFKNSPKWLPAMNHNRKVQYTHRQSITFNQVRN